MTAYQTKLQGMDGNVRVRMAPSPTGNLHIGTARTALFNWLFARSQGGTFVMRIEDTDKERSIKAYEENILQGLRGLGLDWDEGPDIGGAYGPYRQSERTDIYKQYLQKLLDEDKAYRCFCTKEELEAQEQEMISGGEAPKYRGICRNLQPEQIQNNIAKGKSFIIRVRMPAKKISFHDLIRGKITVDTGLLEDIAIAKSTAEPLYNFAVVVDDFAMNITHVIRGEDHVSNTPKQLIIQELLGFPSPQYAHLPLILGPDKSKLSKRHGTTSVDEYLRDGYPPEALVNFIALLGWHPSGDKELFTLDELALEFSLDRIQKSGAIFNMNKFNWLNNYYIRKKSMAELMPLAVNIYEQASLITAASLPDKAGTTDIYHNVDGTDAFSSEYIEKILAITRERLQKLSELPAATDFFFTMPTYNASLLLWRRMTKEQVALSLQKLHEVFSELDETVWTTQTISAALEPLYGADKGEILWPLRVALSGKQFSPGPFDIAAILGKDRVLKRIAKAQEFIQS